MPYCEVQQSSTRSLPELDVLYMTRIQRERFASAQEYLKIWRAAISLTRGEDEACENRTCYVLHPLPRVDEIAVRMLTTTRVRSTSVRRASACSAAWRCC